MGAFAVRSGGRACVHGLVSGSEISTGLYTRTNLGLKAFPERGYPGESAFMHSFDLPLVDRCSMACESRLCEELEMECRRTQWPHSICAPSPARG